MKSRGPLLMAAALLYMVAPVAADTVILHDGSSYSGRFQGPQSGAIVFTDAQGIRYTFPLYEVQSLVFTATSDTITLRTGKVYSGHFTSANTIAFSDSQGIGYQFPLKDVASLVLTRNSPPPGPAAGFGNAKVIPEGTEVSVRTEEAIDSKSSFPGQQYHATVSEDVFDGAGGVAIPRGTPAKLVVRNIDSGGAVHSAELVLDLYSIYQGGKEYRVIASDLEETNGKGVGVNRRTAEFGGVGAGLGALLGAAFGGGEGAAIGAASGAGGGLVTQVFTRGKQVKVPAEAQLTFRLDRTLVLRPTS